MSVIVRSRDEAPRLRLTLASLSRQTVAPEVVVVDDGSRDATADVLAEAAAQMPVTVIRHPRSRGRSVASNAGARAASGEVLLFLDGDTLAAPDLVERHLHVHAQGGAVVARGETHHLRRTRFLQDPETATPQRDHVVRIASLSEAERDALRVTRAAILEDFPAAIDARSQPGVYPGAGPGGLYALEMDALRNAPACGVLWAAATGSNLSASRRDFIAVDGFDEALDRAPPGSPLAAGAGLNEHRDLAYRLCGQGARMAPVEGARTYHMVHRQGWKDPLADTRWAQHFHDKHGDPAMLLLLLLWASLSPQARSLSPDLRITALPALEAAARGPRTEDYLRAQRELLEAFAGEPA